MNLIVVFDKDAYFFPYIDSEENNVIEVLKKNTNFWKAMRIVPFISKCAFNRNLKKKAQKANKIIIFDSAYTTSLGRYLKRYKAINKVYCWNPIGMQKNSKLDCRIETAKKYAQVYSFDLNDCQKYQLNFSPMIYTRRINDSELPCDYNIFFLGAGKNRVVALDKIIRGLLSNVSKCKFIIIGERGDCQNNSIEFSEKRYSYEEYLWLLKKSKILLDIPQEGQRGNTIRVTESLFYKKKLITTNKEIVNCDFYNPNNIFVIGVSPPSSFEKFVNTEYTDIEDAILDKYDFEKWVEMI